MKLVVLTTSYPMHKGDHTGAFVSGLSERLVANGHQVKVVAPHASGTRKLETLDGVKVRRFRYGPATLEQVAYGFGVLGNLKRKLSAKLLLPVFVLAFYVVGLKEAKGADLIHANWTFSGLVAIFIKLTRKVPVVLTVHGSDLAKLPSFMNRFIVKRIDHLIAVSEHLAKEVQELGLAQEKISVIPNGISNLETLRAIPIKSQPTNNILWVGRLSAEKNLDLLIRAFKKVHDKAPKSSLYLVGDGPLKNDLMRLADDLGLNDLVIFVGKQTRAGLNKYYESCDLFVFPSLREGFGLSLAEAMVAGLACITSGQGGTRDIAGNGNAIICKDNCPDKLSKEILRLLEDNEERIAVSKKGRRFAETHFNYKELVNKTETIYRAVTQRKVLFVTRPICPPWDEASKNQAFELAQKINNSSISLLTANDFKTGRTNLRFVNIYRGSHFNNQERLRLLFFLLRHRKEYDLFHLFFTPTLLNTFLLRLVLGNKRVIQSVPCLPQNKTWLRFLFFGSKIITISKKTKEEIQKFTAPGTVTQIRPGVNLKKFNGDIQSVPLEVSNLKDKFIVLYPGEYRRLNATEAMLELVRGMDHEVVVVFACRLKVTQDVKIKNDIMEQLMSEKLSDKVVFLDTVSDMPSLIAAANVVTLPSLDLAGKFDYPLVVLEALASGKPTIVADIDPLSEITDNPGLIGLKPSKIGELCALINKIKADPDGYRALSQGARKTAQKLFDLETTAKKYEEIYDSYE